MPRAAKHRATPSGKPKAGTSPPDAPAPPTGQPSFAQPLPTDDPGRFRVAHGSDAAAYQAIDALNRQHLLAPLPFPPPRGLPEPRLTLAAVLARDAAAVQREVADRGRIVFHATGDTGSTRGPESQNQVADKMVSDFADAAGNRPSFLFHLGDVIYSFGEAQYYYDQFFAPYRDYPAPILAIAGNHDGMVAPGTGATSLAAFLDNFCASDFHPAPGAGGLSRTAQIQPGVFFTFEAPLLRILALYSNTLEDPGVIASDAIGTSQLDYLQAALTRVKAEAFGGALILAHHHPAVTVGAKHGWSLEMTQQIDRICAETGVWPHAVLSAHAHNYQRFTRARQDAQIPYVICGNGGHGLSRLSRSGGIALRTPMALQVSAGADPVTLENYDDQDYGYLRVVVTPTQLRIEYHPASDGTDARTPDDSVTVDLATRKLVHFTG